MIGILSPARGSHFSRSCGDNVASAMRCREWPVGARTPCRRALSISCRNAHQIATIIVRAVDASHAASISNAISASVENDASACPLAAKQYREAGNDAFYRRSRSADGNMHYSIAAMPRPMIGNHRNDILTQSLSQICSAASRQAHA